MNWLITGGCGFIGTQLVARLSADGDHRLRVLDNLTVGTRDDLADVCAVADVAGPELAAMRQGPGGAAQRVELVVGDIVDAELVTRATAGADAVVHLAAMTGVEPSLADPEADCRVNVLGTLACLEAARRHAVRRFVFASSGAPVGEVAPPIREDVPARPRSPYGASKLAGEGYCSAYHHGFGLETVTLRFGNVYGPGSTHKSSVVARFIKDAMAEGVLEIHGDGEQTRDFIYIDDLVDAICRAVVAEGAGGELFQIATSRETSVRELVEALRPVLAEAGIAAPEVRYAAPRRGDVRRNYADTGKAREGLGWQARTALPEGLSRTVEWFVAAGLGTGQAPTRPLRKT